ncbi:hypothetical protein EON64_12945 [archaeon]|nr:MAG: hypothetical protein EON64_12945 [archaeon]
MALINVIASLDWLVDSAPPLCCLGASHGVILAYETARLLQHCRNYQVQHIFAVGGGDRFDLERWTFLQPQQRSYQDISNNFTANVGRMNSHIDAVVSYVPELWDRQVETVQRIHCLINSWRNEWDGLPEEKRRINAHFLLMRGTCDKTVRSGAWMVSKQ